MKIIDIIKSGKPSLSFEVFPPKTSDKFDAISESVTKIAELKPSYMSVTYGAGGGTSKFTVDIANRISTLGVTPLAHLTCISSTKKQVDEMLKRLKENAVENILALRGDIPEGLDKSKLEYSYANELINHIRSAGDFCIGGACYPEGHPESESLDEDIEHLKTKVESGCSFLTTQMFFNNYTLYDFIGKIESKGIFVPVVAGIMPVTSKSQIDRIFTLTGKELPPRLSKIVSLYGDSPEDMKKAGIEFASKQIENLYDNGINAVHVYSMNKPETAEIIQNNFKGILQ